MPRSEITRFPHAVLEVKLSLAEGQQAPEWVRDLIDSGYLTEVHPPILKTSEVDKHNKCINVAQGLQTELF